MKSKRTKVVRGWAVVNDSGIPVMVGNALAIYTVEARRLNTKLIPCTITYSLPHTKKIKKVKK